MKSKRGDARSDVYALGVMVYEMLAMIPVIIFILLLITARHN